MSFLNRTTICCIFFLLICSCKKQEGLIDQYTEPADEVTALKPLVSSAGREFIEIEWNTVVDSHFEEVTYAVYLEGVKIVDQLSSTRYSLINLQPGKKYNIKVIAATNRGKQVEQSLEGSTLPALLETEKVYVRQYGFHEFSTLTGPAALLRLEDGGHLLVMELLHPTDFNHVSYKMIVFRVDKYGQTLWYRLMNFSDFELPVDSAVFQLTSTMGGEQAILFAGTHALKFAVANGDVIMNKSYADLLPEQFIVSAKSASSHEIILGTTEGKLMSVNPANLEVNWHQDNQGQWGTIRSFQVDSKRNIYAIFDDLKEQHTPIKVNKYDPQGKFLKSFQFDGRLEGESNWGFITTALLIDQQDDLYLFGHNASYNYTRYFKFKSDGTLIKKNEQSENFLIRGAYFDTKGDIVANGQLEGTGRNTWGGIYLFDKNLNIKSREIWTNIPPHILAGITGNADGTYSVFAAFVYGYGTNQFQGFSYIRTALNGKI